MACWPPLSTELDAVRRAFDARVDRSGGDGACWPWRGAITKGGYGHIMARGRREFLVHRLALLFAGVPLEPRQLALHACDNPPCCNPAHLRAGNHKDNAVDRSVRRRRVYAVGEGNPACKLTADSVRQIRQRLAAPRRGIQSELAAAYGISPSLVRAIGSRKVWTHV